MYTGDVLPGIFPGGSFVLHFCQRRGGDRSQCGLSEGLCHRLSADLLLFLLCWIFQRYRLHPFCDDPGHSGGVWHPCAAGVFVQQPTGGNTVYHRAGDTILHHPAGGIVHHLVSGGEAQRVKLASELQKKSTGKTVYILDEPTTGLHSHDVARLIDVLQRIVDQGDTIIVIEHNLDVIKVADHIIDLGPEGGAGGGTIVVTGTPEKVAKCEKSYTGQFLKSML